MKKSIVFFANLLFWIANVLLFIFTFSKVITQLNDTEQASFVIAVNLLIALYWILWYRFKIKLLSKRQQIFYSVAFASMSFLIVFFLEGKSVIAGLSGVSLIIIWYYIIRLILYVIHEYTQAKIRQENTKSELALLRSQINPHFLFNNLHNIDALIRTEPETASKLLLKLSEIMRYMLYDAISDTVPLQKEIDHIENFLTLQQYRFQNKLTVSYKRTGEPDNMRIAPMLLIPFIENAFKHFKLKAGENKIDIALNINPPELALTCINLFDPADTNKDSAPGIGLDTVKRRLELIYPHKYRLEISNRNNIFDVRLTIRVNDN